MKKTIYFFMLILLMSFAVADLSDDIIVYYTMDNADIDGSNMHDLNDNINATLTNSPDTGVVGVLDEAVNFTKGSSQFLDPEGVIALDDSFTLCYWAKTTTVGVDYESHFRFASTNGYFRELSRKTEGVYQYDYKDDDGTGCEFRLNYASYVDDDFHFICLIRNGTTADNDCSNELYIDIDGSRVAWTTDTGTSNPDNTMSGDVENFIGRDSADTRGTGTLDEFIIYDVDIGKDNRDLLYNSGNGCNPIDNPTGCGGAPAAASTATITCSQNLTDYTNSSENPLYFGLDCVGGVSASASNIFNISLYLNDALNYTILDFNLNTTILTLNLTYGNEQIGKDINITVTHGEDAANYTTEIVDVFLDSVTPYITFYSPAVNGSVYYKGFDSFVNVSILCDDPNLFSCNLTIMRVNDTGYFNETLNNTFYENITTPNQSIEILRSVQSFADGQYVAIAESADSHTAAYINEYKTKPIQDGYEIEDKIKITSPDLTKFNLEKKYDRYEFDMDFSKSKPDIYVECDDLRIIKNSKYKGHLICWEQKKWIDFEDGSKDPVIISRVSKNKVKVTPQTTIKQFEFKSIGDLNINKVIRYFNVTQNNFAFNIWIYDEDNPSNALPADAEVEVEYYVGSNPNATYYYADLSGGSNYAINISSNESLIRAFVYIKHESENGFVNRYFAVNTTYNTTTGYNFTLYNFNTTTDISGLKITARNFLTYNYYPSVIGRLQRKYVSEGVWRTVQQDQSGDFGVLYFNVREAEVDYRIIFIDQDNNVLKTTDTLKFICTDDLCDLTTLINPYETTVTTADITAGYIYDNATKIINFTWTNNDGDTSTVRMRTRQDTASGATYPCDITQTAAAGSYSCNMTGYSGLTEITIIGDGDILLTEWISIEAAKLGDLIDQREGALWTALILILCATFGIFSPSGAIITSIIGLILVYLLGIFTPLTITIIIIATVIGIAIGFKVRA